MKKLLVLALLGLGLGGGVWKLQNPEGSVEDMRSQAQTVTSRLMGGIQTGVQSVRESARATDAAPDQQALANPLVSVEGSITDQQQITQRLAVVESSVSEQQSLEQRLSDLENSVSDSVTTSNADSDGGRLSDVTQLLSGTDARLDASDQRLGAQDETIAATTASLAEIRNEIAAVSSSFAEVDVFVKDTTTGNEAGIVRLDAIDSRLALLVRRLDEQTTTDDLQSLNESVAGVQNQLTQVDENYATLEEFLSTKLAAVGERADTLNLRLNTLKNSAGSGTDTDSNDSSTPTFNAGLDERFSAIESRLETVNSDSRRIATLSEQLDAARKKITQLEARDAGTIQTVEDINTSIAELKMASDSLSIDTVQTEIRDQLALVQSQFESNIADNNTDALEALLNSTRNQIQTLEKRVQELPAASSEADNAQQIQTALESQIAALERRLETASKADPALADTLSNVQEQVDQLAAKGFVTQADLLTQQESKSVEYKIYFDRNSAEVTVDAAKVLSSFIAQEKNRTTGVSIFGFTDRRGSAIYNQQLALQRATSVRSYLIQNGLDYTKIKALSGLGEDAAAAVLPDDSDSAQQRVVVLYAAQK